MSPGDYFRYTQDYFWKWEDDGEVIGINGGSTIVYTEELIQILDAVSIHGLPSFGSILLAIIATNSTLDNSMNYIQVLFKKISENHIKNNIWIQNTLEESLNFLTILHNLPEQIKHKKTRHYLLQILFKDSHNRINIPTSIGIINYFKSKSKSPYSKVYAFELQRFQKDITTLSLLYRKFNSTHAIIDAFNLELQIKNIDDLNIDFIPSEKKEYTDFIEELIDNANTFHLGALIKPLWAGLNIPIFNSQSSDQPLGGYSDISNKGDFDKLLISEFANDDIVFMTRLANNEALYLHRELPPVKDKQKRYMLVDTSIKNWGIPKLINLGASIALSRDPKSKFDNIVYTLSDTFDIVNYLEINQIIDAQQRVNIALNTSNGLISFISEFKLLKNVEAFFFTSSDALKSPEIIRILIDNYKLIKFIIASNTAGQITIYLNKNGNLKAIHSIKLDLDKLWERKQGLVEKTTQSQTIPNQFPILSPYPNTKSNNILYLNETEVYLVWSRYLYKNFSAESKFNNQGFQEMRTDIHPAGSYCIGKNSAQEVLFLEYIKSEKLIHIINLNTNQKLTESSATIIYKSNKYLIYKDNAFILFGSADKNFVIIPDFENKKIDIKEIDYDYNSKNYDVKNALEKQVKSVDFLKQNLLTKISNVYINQDKKLIIGQHILDLFWENSIHLSGNNAFSSARLSETKTKFGKNNFLFKDGSTITAHKNNILSLVSSNTSIPPIYIPLCISIAIGVATETHFSGNDYFFNQNTNKCSIKILNSSTNKLDVVKIIRNYSSLGLKEIKEGIDYPPFIVSNINKNQLFKFTKELTELGVDIEEIRSTKQEQTIIEPKQFFDIYISPFIQTILDYENRA